MGTLPNFPVETCNRLLVQTRNRDTDWSDPRPAHFDDLLAVCLELGSSAQGEIVSLLHGRLGAKRRLDDLIEDVRLLWPEHRAELAGAIGLLPTEMAERLVAVEGVLDALGDAQLAIDRFRAYRAKYPVVVPDDPEPPRSDGGARAAIENGEAPSVYARAPDTDSSNNEPQQEDDGTPW